MMVKFALVHLHQIGYLWPCGFGVELWDHCLHGLIVRVPIARVSMRVAPSLVQEDPSIRVMSSEILGTHKSLQKADEI